MSRYQGKFACSSNQSLSWAYWSAKDIGTIKRLVIEHPQKDWEELQKSLKDKRYHPTARCDLPEIRAEVDTTWQKIADEINEFPKIRLDLDTMPFLDYQKKQKYNEKIADGQPEISSNTPSGDIL
ncbi:hypothetical protein BOTCAL_0448g00060 [Botryotinia calthae]|uniref:Uncharacterized protein n=1 Tax=Botryotinia calthae TaxID=38488 RepID=A0A4Y8CN82_9HELO|nr:hypothetical protein BOTCAL_0448g00060 [Botryotinia calthae]